VTQIRELEPGDAEALRAFLAAVPADDRSFFKEDVTDPAVADAWIADPRSERLVAVDDAGTILAFAALSPGVARTSHVADLRVVVAAPARGRGIGPALARRLLLAAVERGLRKVTVDVAATQTGGIEMFRRLGFEPEALLRDHLCDGRGELQDVVVLAHLVDETWAGMLTAGLEDPR
jgi:ribosomal protein S18 acetylase RimI-like enzyme